jgi:hypothetical protein
MRTTIDSCHCERSDTCPGGQCQGAIPSTTRRLLRAGKRRPRNNEILALLLGLAILLGSANPARAQSGVEVADVQVTYTFGTEVNFSAKIASPIPIQSATISFRPANGNTQSQTLSFGADGTADYRFDARANTLPPFAPVVFWFDVTLSDGTRFTSGTYNFRYADNRFTWRDLEDGALRVHWYEGKAAFGAAALDAARRGLPSISNLIPVNLSEPLDIYVYASPAVLQSALTLGGRAWIEGNAIPELGVAMVSVPPGAEQSLALEQDVPHEMTHVLLYRNVGANYYRLPNWLREGMATLAESYPNPDWDAALSQAVETQSLLPLSDLCASFPTDSGTSFLAYAESRSFTKFILDNFGASGLSALTASYADGLDCEQGASQALGSPLSDLEIRWRESVLGENRGGTILSNLLPYLIVVGLVLLAAAWGVVSRLFERSSDGGEI